MFKTTVGIVSRPLGDKTPLPNRLGTVVFETPLDKAKALKPSVLRDLSVQPTNFEGDDFPELVQRPSSLRKNLRLPSNLSLKKNLETPVNQGIHWNMSDGDIVHDSQLAQQESVDEDKIDQDEIEYCPPNTLGMDYQFSSSFITFVLRKKLSYRFALSTTFRL